MQSSVPTQGEARRERCSDTSPSNPHGPFGFWRRMLGRVRVRQRNVDQGNWMLANFLWNQFQPVVIFICRFNLLFFCFVDGSFKVCTHLIDGWILYVLVVVMCSLLDLNRRLKVDSVPARLEDRGRRLSTHFSELARRKIVPKES